MEMVQVTLSFSGLCPSYVSGLRGMEYAAEQYRCRSRTQYRLANLPFKLVRRRKWRRCFRCNRYCTGFNNRPQGVGVAYCSCIGHRRALGNACGPIRPLMSIAVLVIDLPSLQYSLEQPSPDKLSACTCNRCHRLCQ